jgi:uncharacterized membrane protein YdjX (TVP38/TMEM64 family)
MKKDWFRPRQGLTSKDRGIGYAPVSWKGITSYIILAVLIVLAGFAFDLFHASLWQGIGFLVTVIILFFLFHLFARTKSKPMMGYVSFKKKNE